MQTRKIKMADKWLTMDELRQKMDDGEWDDVDKEITARKAQQKKTDSKDSKKKDTTADKLYDYLHEFSKRSLIK